MKKIITVLTLCSFFFIGRAIAMDSASHDHAKQDGQAAMDQPKMESMDHSQMDHGSSQEGGVFKEMVMVDGIHAEFQVMELASMNMTDPEGHTHHVMATFMKDGKKIDKAVGKIKIISPSGKDQIADLKDFGSGVYAANFTIDEDGKWGVICLFKDADGKHTAKFWYQHGMM
jgi:hypothetical protein